MNRASMPDRNGSTGTRRMVLLVAAVSGVAAIVWSLQRGGDQAQETPVLAANDAHLVASSPAHQVPTRPPASNAALPSVPGLVRRTEGVVLGSVTRLAAPSDDEDWKSEKVSKEVEGRLAEIAEIARRSGQGGERWDDVVDARFSCRPLRPELTPVFRDGPITVLRPAADLGSVPESPGFQGRDGFGQALASLLEPFGDSADVRFAFKVIGIELGDRITTEILVETAGVRPDAALQQTARWRCQWIGQAENASLLLASIETQQYEESRFDLGGSHVFQDRTVSAMEWSGPLRDQLGRGMEHWHHHLELAFGFDHGMQGLAVGDVNGDGLDDLYVCQPAGLVNRLLVRSADGRLQDHTPASGADWLDVSRAALLIDLDNDGDQDLVVSISNRVVIHTNDGQGRFQPVTAIETPSDLYSLCAADYDADGDLDIFACGYTRQGQLAVGDSFADPMPYHDANNGGPNVLLRNDGAFRFADVTRDSGMAQNNRRFSYAAAWEDYDNDGDMDLYVANDFGRNNLYRNDAGRFSDVAASEGVEDVGAGMSVAWGDVDLDGLMDLYVGNMFSSAGYRVTGQERFQTRFGAAEHADLRRHARGNSLFRRMADGTFRDCSLEARVDVGRWAWGSIFFDVNNDGWEDIYVANGFFTSEDTVDL